MLNGTFKGHLLTGLLSRSLFLMSLLEFLMSAEG